MAEGAGLVYNGAKLALMRAEIDLEGDTLKIALLDGTYTPNIDTETFFNQVSSKEVSGTGYTAGGKALSGKSASTDTGNDRAVFDATDLTWTGINVGTPGYAVLYKDTGNPSTSPLIGCWELGTTPTNGGDYTIQFNASGVLSLA